MIQVAVFSNVLEPGWSTGAVSFFLELFLFPFPFLRRTFYSTLHYLFFSSSEIPCPSKSQYFILLIKYKFGVGNKKFSSSKNNGSEVGVLQKNFLCQQKSKIEWVSITNSALSHQHVDLYNLPLKILQKRWMGTLFANKITLCIKPARHYLSLFTNNDNNYFFAKNIKFCETWRK